MAESLSPAMAVRSYLREGPNGCEFTSGEFMEFWRSLTPEEKKHLGEFASAELGVELKATPQAA